ncbi:MAG: GEVED domain-containing protein, partial [Chloroflexota bacterium]
MTRLVNHQLTSNISTTFFGRMAVVLFAFGCLFGSFHSVFALDSSEPFYQWDTVAPIDPVPFSMELSCATLDCKKPILVELSRGLSIVRVSNSASFSLIDQNLADNQLALTLPRNFDNNLVTVNLLLEVDPLSSEKPILQVGQVDNGSVIWQEKFEINNQSKAGNTEISESPNNPVYLANQFSHSVEGEPLLHIAPANLTDQFIEELNIVIDFPAGVPPEEFKWGPFKAVAGESSNIPVKVSYQENQSSSWESWGELSPKLLEPLMNPPSFPDLEVTEQLTQPISISSVDIELENVPPGYRWGGYQQDQPTFKLLIPTDFESNWVEICQSASGTLADETEFTLERTCHPIRVKDDKDPTPNLNLRVEAIGATNNPRPGTIISFAPSLQLTNVEQSSLDFVVNLPNWLKFITSTTNLEFIPGQPITSTAEVDLSPQLPSFEQRLALDDGNRRLIWRWSELTPLNAITMPVIQVEVLPGLPVGETQLPFYVLSNDRQSCWDIPPSGRDLLDIDLDQNKSELFCQTLASVQVESVAGISADLLINGPLAPSNPVVANLSIINGGTQIIREVDAVVPVPKEWMIVPPDVPESFSLAYTISDDWCNGEKDCDAADWQFSPPANMRDVTALRLKASDLRLAAGNTHIFQIFLQPPAELEVEETILWESIRLSGITNSGESVGFELQPKPLEIQSVVLAAIQGQAWLDTNQNGLFDDSGDPVSNTLIALISPGGDGEPTTADDRILRWAMSGEDGFYRFSEVLPATYYLATISNQLFPTSLTVAEPLETDRITAFDEVTLRTELFSISREQASLPLNLALATGDRNSFAGRVVFDRNQNQIWDDPISAGVNNLSVELIEADNQLIARTTTRTDSFGHPGSFNLEAPSTSNQDWILRFTSSFPFVGGIQLVDGSFQLDLPAESEMNFEVLIDQASFGIDLGDAPASYGIAEHKINPNITLGLISDGEVIPTNWTADVALPEDDATNRDDEDGIFFTPPKIDQGQEVENQVVVVMRNQNDAPQNLNGWIDFDGDGKFSDTEQVINDHLVFPDQNPQGKQFGFETPSNSVCGPTFARFRLGSADIQASGRDNLGEVEDIAYNIQCVTDLELTLEPQVTPMGPNELSNWYLSVSNNGTSFAEQVSFNVTIPTAVNYQGIVSLTNDPVACT